MIIVIIVGVVIFLVLIIKGIGKLRGFCLYKEEFSDEFGIYEGNGFEDIVYLLEDFLLKVYV